MQKSKITKLFKYGVWKVTNRARPYPMYVFSFYHACVLARRMSTPEKEWLLPSTVNDQVAG